MTTTQQQQRMREFTKTMTKTSRHQIVWRWFVTAGVVTLAIYGLWSWAWLVLALAALHLFGDVGLALVVGQIGAAVVVNNGRNTK